MEFRVKADTAEMFRREVIAALQKKADRLMRMPVKTVTEAKQFAFAAHELRDFAEWMNEWVLTVEEP